MGKRLMILAGGTGGHVFPALAVADLLRKSGCEISWLGTRRGIEARLVPASGFDVEWIRVSGFRGKGVTGWLVAPFKLLLSVVQALRAIRKVNPDAVLGMGGFVTGPGGIAAKLLRKPLLLHEQNAVAGMANKLLAPYAERVMEGFKGCFPSEIRALATGNPVRPELLNLDEPAARQAKRTGPLRILVIGGSQGAVALNRDLPQALKPLLESGQAEIWHQAGERHHDEARERYSAISKKARVDTFIENMAMAYTWADLVICRAGALTVAELSAVGVASLLVPFPYAVDDHQTKNGQTLVDAGAAKMFTQTDINSGALTRTIRKLIKNRDSLLDMAIAARNHSPEAATESVAEICMEVMQAGQKRESGGQAS